MASEGLDLKTQWHTSTSAAFFWLKPGDKPWTPVQLGLELPEGRAETQVPSEQWQ